MADLELASRAIAMRNMPTEPEKRLWRHLSNAQLGGFKFRRQAVIPPYIADFLCPARAFIVEVDGDTHDVADDGRRDAFLRSRGYHVLRFSNYDVMTNSEGVLTVILSTVGALPPRWPHPNPSPEGEGLAKERPGSPRLQGRGGGGEPRPVGPPRS